jgi:hypothetical protein
LTSGSKISKNYISKIKQNTVFKLSVCMLGIVGYNPKKIEAKTNGLHTFFRGKI